MSTLQPVSDLSCPGKIYIFQMVTAAIEVSKLKKQIRYRLMARVTAQTTCVILGWYNVEH